MKARKSSRPAPAKTRRSRFLDMIEGSVQGIFVHREHEILFANQALVGILGYGSIEEVLAVRDVLQFVHPDERDRLTRYRDDRNAGRPVPSQYEFRALARDGSTVWVENIARIIEWDDGPAILSIIVDITERKRAEAALRESEARFRDLVEGSIQGIFVHRDFKPLFANQALADMLGYDSPEDILALRSVMDFIHPDERERTTGYKVSRLAGDDAPRRYEMRAVRRDGQEIWLENSSRAVDWDGVRVIQGTVVDITERKRAEQSLRESEARFRDLVEGSIQGVVIHRDFKPLFANEAVARMLGYERVETLLEEHSILDFVHPDDHPRMIVYNQERPVGGDVPARYRLRAVRRDGAEIWLENVARVVDWGGLPAIQATFVDVTENKRNEEALRNSEASLRNAQRIARIGSWDRDVESGTLSWSDMMFDLFGMDPETDTPSFEGFLRRVHPDDRTELRKAVKNALNGIAPYDMDFRVVLPGGGERIIHGQGEVVRNAKGEPVSFSGTAQDVTGLRAAEAEVRRLNEELEQRVEQRTRELRNAQAELIKKDRLATLGQLTATVSHELRNPLGAMRTSIYVLSQRADKDDERAHRAIERVERGIARCDRIIDELLDFTRAREIDRRPVDFDQWLGELLDELGPVGGAAIERDFGVTDRAVLIDADRMRRAVINLVDNASQAMDGQEQASITVSTCLTSGNVEIRIADCGPGIGDEVLPHIFEPLFSTKNFGVGLGLPTVRNIAEQHRGSVEVERTGPSGTVFRLSFPVGGNGDGGTSDRNAENAGR